MREASTWPYSSADTNHVAVQLAQPTGHDPNRTHQRREGVARQLVVTYHYVREKNSDGVTGITPSEFAAQIRAIQTGYRIVTMDEFAEYPEAGEPIALITFDDAVRDQFLAASILDDHGVPGVFFAPMRPYSNESDRWCAQHLLHALAEHFGWREFERRVEPFLAGVEIDTARMNHLYHYEAPQKRRLKFALAFAIPPRRAWDILREINAGVGLSPDDWFMSRVQLSELQTRGHALGGHGFDHVPFTVLSPDEQAVDMRRAAGTMNALFGARPRPLAYPFGRCDETTEALARACGYTMTFTTSDRVDAKFLMQELARRANEDVP